MFSQKGNDRLILLSAIAEAAHDSSDGSLREKGNTLGLGGAGCRVTCKVYARSRDVTA